MKKLTVLFLLAILLGCDQASKADYDDARAFAAPPAYENLVDMPATSKHEEPQSASPDQKLIKTARLEFETKDLKVTKSELKSLSREFAGYISNERTEERAGSRWLTVEIKVPVTQFDALLDRISQKVERFDQLDVNSQDVTEEYTDLQTRIATKKKVEQRYLELLAQAKTIEDILKVEIEAGKVREEIERLEGRIKYLGERVSMSTIQIAVYQELPMGNRVDEPSFFTSLVQALANGVTLIRVLLIGLASVWPLILIVGGIWFWYRKKFHKPNVA